MYPADRSPARMPIGTCAGSVSPTPWTRAGQRPSERASHPLCLGAARPATGLVRLAAEEGRHVQVLLRRLFSFGTQVRDPAPPILGGRRVARAGRGRDPPRPGARALLLPPVAGSGVE